MVEAKIEDAIASNRVPSGITVEYLSESKDYGTIVGMIFVAVFTGIIVALRCYARLAFNKIHFGLDDILAVISLFFYIAFIVLGVILVKLGSGRHQEYITYVLDHHTLNVTEVLDYIGHILYAVALYICRCSGLAFYRRISRRHHGLLLSIKVAVWFITLAFVTQFFLILFHCLPITALWPYAFQEEFKDYKCLIWGVVYTANSAISLTCDLSMFIIPGAIITSLHERLRTKIKLSFILLPGVLVIVISSVRLYYVVKGGWLFDGAWFYDPQLVLESAEIGGTLTALSVPGLKPLFGTLYSNFKGPDSSSGTGGTSSKSWLKKSNGSGGSSLPRSVDRYGGKKVKPGNESDTQLVEVRPRSGSSG